MFLLQTDISHMHFVLSYNYLKNYEILHILYIRTSTLYIFKYFTNCDIIMTFSQVNSKNLMTSYSGITRFKGCLPGWYSYCMKYLIYMTVVIMIVVGNNVLEPIHTFFISNTQLCSLANSKQ